MRLSRKELQVLRLLRLHLQELIADSHGASYREAAASNRVARQYLRWVERTLLEEHPDQGELAENMRKLEGAAGALVRATNDMIDGA